MSLGGDIRSDWPHKIDTSREGIDDRLRVIEAWLQGWAVPHWSGATLMAKGTLSICFAKDKLARACSWYLGRPLILPDEIEAVNTTPIIAVFCLRLLSVIKDKEHHK